MVWNRHRNIFGNAKTILNFSDLQYKNEIQ